jgi:quercetin dioxygenase-like cupin family protein
MRLFSFEVSTGRPVTQWMDQDGVPHRVDPKTSKAVINPLFFDSGFAKVAHMTIRENGFLPRHPAVIAQLFAVVEGSGWVSGADGERVPIKPGQAAFWAPGEEHESGTESGMKAIVIEGESFDPSKYMREIRR